MVIPFWISADQFLHPFVVTMEGTDITGPAAQQAIFSVSRANILLSALPVNNKIDCIDRR